MTVPETENGIPGPDPVIAAWAAAGSDRGNLPAGYALRGTDIIGPDGFPSVISVPPGFLEALERDSDAIAEQMSSVQRSEPVPARWRTLYESGPHDGAPVRLDGMDATTPSGAHYVHHRLVTAEGRTGAVVIAECGGSIAVLVDPRPAVGTSAVLYELPRGMGEPDETPEVTAVRELKEETGLAALDTRVLGLFATDSAVYPQQVAAIACSVDPAAPADGEDGEAEGIAWLRSDQVAKAMRAGLFTDAITLSALGLYLAQDG